MMILKDLIAFLESLPQDKVIRHGFSYPDSWRGDYTCLRFEPAENVTVASMLHNAKCAVDSTYTGWKGGEFTMTLNTKCYIAEVGQYEGSTMIGDTLIKYWSEQ